MWISNVLALLGHFKVSEENTVLYLRRLHAKLGEEDEAAKLYNRFIAQAESAKVIQDY